MGTDTKSAPPWLYDMLLVWRLSLCCGFASAESLRPVLNFTAMFVFVTRHTLIWQGTKFSVFFLCPVTDISATVAPIGVKFSIFAGVSSLLFGPVAPRGSPL